METFKIKISELNHPEKNVRKHPRRQIDEMKRSLKMFGQYRPVIVDENNTILVGNGMVIAMREDGIEEVEAIKYDNLTEKQKKKLMIADNQLSSLGVDNLDVIEEFIKSLDGDFDVPGYDEETLEMLVMESEEVTNQALQYGSFTPEEISGVKQHEEEPIKPVTQTYQEPIQRSGFTETQIEQQTKEVTLGEPRTQAPMEREQYVICPHCNEKIWLE